MSNLATCPDREEFERLRLGRLSHEQAVALDEHLLACESCCQVLHELDAGDSLAETMNALGTRESVIDDRVHAVIARLKEMTLPGKAIEETLVRGRDATTDAWDLEKLLDAPLAEGELGRFAGYRVFRVLGAGGMGLVLEAEDPQLRRRVALKVMQRSLAAHEENRQRFLREARATAAIEHAHIVTVHQVGEHNGLPFMAMQLLKGESLQERLERVQGKGSGFRVQGSGRGAEHSLPLPPGEGRGEGGLQRSEAGHSDGKPLGAATSPHPNPLPEGEGTKASLPLTEVLRIGREIAEALAEAHSRKLIHRDIKPGNIWLEGASGWVKLVDFGLAHAAEDVHLTQTGAILGTPAYMSPEQARGEAVDGRTDLYSLGAVLYKLTTGDVPFRGASTMAVLMALATQTPRRPIEINPDIPPALNDLILRLLAKQPDERCESAAAVAEAIREIEASRVGIAHHRVADATPANPTSAAHPKGLGGQCPPHAGRPARPRWPLIAAAAAAALVLATIVIIIRDKDGRETGRLDLPDGSSVTVTNSHPSANENRDRPGNAASPDARPGGPATNDRQAVGNIPPPGNFPEPPPLEEWLKGRTVLTVAQDGSGQFKTIQAALNALKPHQVVEVLDGGPYRERLEVFSPGADTGLISRRGTIIHMPEERGHLFDKAFGFRLSGFEFVPFEAGFKDAWMHQLGIFNPSGVVVEHCRFRPMPTEPRKLKAIHLGFVEERGDEAVFIRDCIIEGSALLQTIAANPRRSSPPRVVFERNWMPSRDYPDPALEIDGITGSYVIRHNVIDRATASGIVLSFQAAEGDPRGQERAADYPAGIRLLIYNNSLRDSGVTVHSWWKDVVGHVDARGNIFGAPVRFLEGSLGQLGIADRSWKLDHNFYTDPSERLDAIRPGPTDLRGDPRLASHELADPGYMRPLANSPLAAGAPGGDWPSYIGALPPGPAPKEGDWFTRLRERWLKVGRASPTVDSVVGNAHPTILEPPPLEEWLKGRTVLTVAQDGSGQFKTIQAALDALRPGQVVRVLDRGPYRERIQLSAPPEDIGLISDQPTVLEIADWNRDYPGEVIGFKVWRADGFRLCGFDVIYQKPPKGLPLSFADSGDVVVERCVLRELSDEYDPQAPLALAMHWTDNGRGEAPACIRDSAIEGAVLLDMHGGKKGGAMLVRNYFTEHRFTHDPTLGLSAVWVAGWRGPLRLSNNIIDTRISGGLNLNCAPGSDQPLIFVNNTILSRTNSFGGELPPDVFLANNLFQSGMGLPRPAPSVIEKWRIGPNAYFSKPQPNELPRRARDIRAPYKFLSEDFADREFARLLPESELATRGGGGELPSYMGALPPGPAPKEGDWFTRLRERWTKVGWALPTTESTVGNAHPTIPEPPSLEEWLKGRTVLTVAQDGSAQFKTIQEALHALKPHQVVKVLDRGPYRESISTGGLPKDTGLISDQRTTVETLAWPDDGAAHAIGPIEKFRLAGMRFIAPPRDSWGMIVICGEPSGLVVEDCCFALTAAQDPSRSVGGLVFDLQNDVSDDNPIVIRDCLFDYAILSITGERRSTFVVERNYFRNSNVGLGNRLDRAIVRHNVFDGAKACFWIQGLTDISRVLEIRNNTAATGVSVVQAAPPRGVILRNNITEHDVAFNGEAYKLRTEIAKNWLRDHNAYLRPSLLAKSPTDVTDDPAYLASEPADRNYLRIPADGPQATGGAGGELPTYMGALPPGPAPKDGDWFTRLRERWADVGRASPGGESKAGNAHPTTSKPE